ncbi:C1 family peptidase [Legionella shakespearei]|uniref:Cysteine protease n=1 Tax=Legionella shakespearei DSM 23087 TaxID=1122169 RepID=A0A0W0YLS4_9GAMM|nr:C1 family peptidase [Legionella shakespearei]KTD57826.1 cysteine protease [Legionella shakespearei DSM 23087]
MKLRINAFLLPICVLGMLTTSGAFADAVEQDVTIVGSIKHTLNPSHIPSYANPDVAARGKVIQLLKVELSDEEKALLKSRANDASKGLRSFKAAATSEFPTKIQLGMKGVPVLDQGMHGTCVTFAVTGALDAEMNKGDYVSQVCNLQLGTYLENHGYGYSGWNGSFAADVVNQIEQYGIVNKKKQKKKGCGGLTEYPAYSTHKSSSYMDPEQFKSMSELVFGKELSWLNVYNKKDPKITLNEVKRAINQQNRLTFGVLLPRVDLGEAGAVGKHNTWLYKDTWVLTPEILKGVDSVEAGHEMIITGYDDHAVAVDNHGVKHKGLLTLRNSWSTAVGDNGEFYMSYDYFKLLAIEVTQFSPYSAQ